MTLRPRDPRMRGKAAVAAVKAQADTAADATTASVEAAAAVAAATVQNGNAEPDDADQTQGVAGPSPGSKGSRVGTPDVDDIMPSFL
jgi:hypothetical protein